MEDNKEIPTLDDILTPSGTNPIDPYVPVLTPMDKKTIVNAIEKRIPEIKRIHLVEKMKEKEIYQLVLVCALKHETAIIVEDHFDMFMRHSDLMNVVDRLAEEVKLRKKKIKNNMLPASFLRSTDAVQLRRF
jgi:isochorismate hydrolase